MLIWACLNLNSYKTISKPESDFLRENCSLPQNVIQVIPLSFDDFVFFFSFFKTKLFSKHQQSQNRNGKGVGEPHNKTLWLSSFKSKIYSKLVQIIKISRYMKRSKTWRWLVNKSITLIFCFKFLACRSSNVGRHTFLNIFWQNETFGSCGHLEFQMRLPFCEKKTKPRTVLARAPVHKLHSIIDWKIMKATFHFGSFVCWTKTHSFYWTITCALWIVFDFLCAY